MEPGLATEVKFVRAVDADTIEVEISRRFHVRLRDIDCPELKTDEGRKAYEEANWLLSTARKIIAFIPTNDSLKLMDINSFGRLVGDIYIDGVNLAHKLKELGYTK